MKKALISPIEPVETGYRVAQVVDAEFPISEPLFWADCSDEVLPDEKWYDPTDGSFKDMPAPPPIEPAPNQPTTSGTQTL